MLAEILTLAKIFWSLVEWFCHSRRVSSLSLGGSIPQS